MMTHSLGQSELEFTRVGIGTFAMGGEGWRASWGPQKDEDSIAAIHAGLDAGANWIDTAPVYGLGHAETIVGQALKGLAHKPYIATKCALRADAERIYGDQDAAFIREECDRSLLRFGVDTIDLLQMHWPKPQEQIEEGWLAMSDLVAAGKARFLGVSNFNVDQMRRIQAIHPITSLQPPYSLLERGIEEEILPFCREHNIGVLGYGPMHKGLLTGTFTAERAASLPETDHRRGSRLFTPPALHRVLDFVEQLAAISAEHDRTPAELAIAWILAQPGITCAIVGLRSGSQAGVLSGGDWALDTDTLSRVNTALRSLESDLAHA